MIYFVLNNSNLKIKFYNILDIMTSFMDAIDNYTSNLGENGHCEYGWTNNLQEKICQFQFQLVRTTSSQQLSVLADVLRGLLRTIRDSSANVCKNTGVNTSSDSAMSASASATSSTSASASATSSATSNILTEYLSVLYCLLAQTRDIIDGKGECQLTYMMLLVWYEFYPELALNALESLVHSPMDSETKVVDVDFHPYGSWKDMKYFANYCKLHGCSNNHPLIKRIIYLINMQLHFDNLALDEPIHNVDEPIHNISLAAKWIPRESSNQFGWLNKLLAMDYYRDIMATSRANQSTAQTKCIMLYRKLLSKINKTLDTIQIKQCDHKWSSISHSKTTSVTFIKQSKALYNVDKKGNCRSSEPDRIKCAENLKEFVAERVATGKEIKGGRVGMADFTKKAISLISSRQTLRHDETVLSEIALLNSQWRDSSALNGPLSDVIAMVDVSGSMEGDPINVAISLGIRVAEKSKLGKRVMTFSSNPHWVRLSGDYIDMVEQISKAEWGTGTNFYKALDLILDACIQNKVLPEVVGNMVLAIFSDMQIESGDSGYKSMQAGIKQKYKNAGYNDIPHILFWNLRSTGGFPTLMSEPNVSTMSGFSPALLNQFCEKGIAGLSAANPWTSLVESLFTDRYKQMDNQIRGLV